MSGTNDVPELAPRSPTRLWLIGGTRESVELAEALRGQRLPFWVTVTTASARQMYGPGITVQVGPLASAEMQAWIWQAGIAAIVDASHPFAVEVSRGAIAAAARCQLPYLRFERARGSSGAMAPAGDGDRGVQSVPNLAALLMPERLVGQRTLLILGYRMLHYFQPWQAQTRLFARILPSVVALEAALGAGFGSDRLIALRPPVSVELEAALWKQWGITQAIAKASGPNGGEDVKRQVAQTLGVPLWLIDRPGLDYPEQTDGIARVLAFAREHLAIARPTDQSRSKNPGA